MSVRNEFHRVMIGQYVFIAFVGSEGPSLSVNRAVFREGIVLLGFITTLKKVGGEWGLYRLDTELKVRLPRATDDDAKLISSEFGIKIQGSRKDPDIRKARVWRELGSWCLFNRNASKAYAECDKFIPGWHDLAIKDANKLIR